MLRQLLGGTPTRESTLILGLPVAPPVHGPLHARSPTRDAPPPTLPVRCSAVHSDAAELEAASTTSLSGHAAMADGSRW